MSNGLRQEDPLRRLLEKDAVIDTVNRLFRGVDERDWALVEACLAPRVHFDMASVSGDEPAVLDSAEIIEGWREGLSHLEGLHHQAGNYEVEISGEEAAAFCYGIALHYLPNETGRATRTFVGTYDLNLRKHRGAWRVDRLRYDLKFLDGNTDLEGAAGRG